jgi:2-keto-4-pentenoate hydratase/2-oxohepta-3-ene-1,7-dioic acid hydratase in catechol pathway
MRPANMTGASAMRLVSYRDAEGVTFGSVEGDRIHELGRRHGIISLRAALAQTGVPAPGAATDARLADVQLLPPVPDAARIVCVGLNYKSHVAEASRALPEHPSVFLRAVGAVVGHGNPMSRPRASERYDFEGELALVVGRHARHVPKERALDIVAGWTCFNDGSLRDFQQHSTTAGKNFDSSGACGPWLVTVDELRDGSDLAITTRLNDIQVQGSRTSRMIFDIPTIIAYITTFMALEPGDIISTGTPEGVGMGRKPPLWMKPGDRIEIEIEGIGTLTNSIVAE